MEPKNPKVGSLLGKSEGHVPKVFASLVFKGEVSRIGEADQWKNKKKEREGRGRQTRGGTGRGRERREGAGGEPVCFGSLKIT